MEKVIDNHDLAALDQRFRAALVNSLSGFKSLNLVGTRSATGATNLAIFNSVFHLGAHPALAGLVVRPDSVERHTLDNILATRFYTINQVHHGIYRQAHQTAARYARDVSEFDACGLTPEYRAGIAAPFVKESYVRLGVEFKQRIDIGLNGTVLVLGQILQIHFPEQCQCADGYLDLEKAGTLAGSGLDSYHRTQRIERLSYAKPGVPLQEVLPEYLVEPGNFT